MKNKELLLEISYKCNLNCIHCSSIGTNIEYKIKIKDISKLVNLDEIESVRISGGEPTLLDNLCEYVNFFYDRDIKIILQTNGTNKIDNKIFNKLDEIWLSIYGKEDLHNFIVGNTTCYEKARWYFGESITKIQSPVFNFPQIMSLFNNENIWMMEFRLFALLNQGRCNFALPIKEQIKIIKGFEGLSVWKYLELTCSVDTTKCNYENKLVLKPDGSLFNCASHKHGRTLCKK